MLTGIELPILARLVGWAGCKNPRKIGLSPTNPAHLFCKSHMLPGLSYQFSQVLSMVSGDRSQPLKSMIYIL